MLYNFTFLLSSLFFFFLKIWSEIGIRIIHGPALYTGKYGICRAKVFEAISNDYNLQQKLDSKYLIICKRAQAH